MRISKRQRRELIVKIGDAIVKLAIMFACLIGFCWFASAILRLCGVG